MIVARPAPLQLCEAGKYLCSSAEPASVCVAVVVVVVSMVVVGCCFCVGCVGVVWCGHACVNVLMCGPSAVYGAVNLTGKLEPTYGMMPCVRHVESNQGF